MSAVSVCSCSLFLLTATIVNPSFANLLATAWPIPGPAPAIKQTGRPLVIIFTELYLGVLPMLCTQYRIEINKPVSQIPMYILWAFVSSYIAVEKHHIISEGGIQCERGQSLTIKLIKGPE